MSALLQFRTPAGAFDDVIAPDYVHNGIPYVSTGEIAVDSAGAITHYHQGLGFTAAGRIASTIAPPEYYGSGSAGFVDGRLCTTVPSLPVAGVHGNLYTAGSLAVTTGTAAIIEPPTDLAGTGFFDPPGRVVLTWTDNSGNDSPATSYKIYREGQPTVTVNAPTLTYTDTRSLDPDKSYKYQIQIINANGSSTLSAPASVAIPNLELPAAPAWDAIPATNTNGGFFFEWDEATQGSWPIAGYNVYRDGGLIAEKQTSTNGTFSVPVGTTASFQVAAVDNQDNVGKLSTAITTPLSVSILVGASWQQLGAAYVFQVPPGVVFNAVQLTSLVVGQNYRLTFDIDGDVNADGFFFRPGVLGQDTIINATGPYDVTFTAQNVNGRPRWAFRDITGISQTIIRNVVINNA